jgi:hypothetical protein
MCGKFTAMASWAEVVAFSQPLIRAVVEDGDNRPPCHFSRHGQFAPHRLGPDRGQAPCGPEALGLARPKELENSEEHRL